MENVPLNFISDRSFDEQIAYCSADERASLATYWLAQGELCLLKEDLAGLDYFEKATELDPCNPELFYRQGLALFEYGSAEGKEKALLLAGKKFKIATTLYPEYFDAWQAWGNALSLLGITYQEHHYFLDAEDKLKKAILYSENRAQDLLADLYWDYGVVWTRIGQQSGEAIDLQLALDAFLKAAQYQESLPAEFWNDYGTACLELSRLIGDVRQTIKAIHCFKQAAAISIGSYESWMQLADAFQSLYAHTFDEDHFTQANQCFAAAAHLQPHNTMLWLRWASFLSSAGRKNRDVRRLRSCIEKCQRSYAYNPKQPHLLAIWAETLALVGELSEKVDLIHEAQNKISEAVDLSDEEDTAVWYSYGMCLNSFGRYFNDVDYHYQAIEKYQQGLSIDRTCHQLWFAIAKSYALIGQVDEDLDAMEKSARFYAKALDLHTSSYYLIEYAQTLSWLGDLKEDQQMLEESVAKFEVALSMQKNALYVHPEWLFQYAIALDTLGDFHEDESYYLRSIEALSQVLMIDPDFPEIHHRLALAFSHIGELMGDIEHFHRSIHHFKLAARHDEENDQVILDWGICLINIAQHGSNPDEASMFYQEAAVKISQSAKLGNLQSFYHLACLYSLLGQYDRAFAFIEKSHEVKSLPPLEEVMDDEWLDGLRSTSCFQDFISHFDSSSQ